MPKRTKKTKRIIRNITKNGTKKRKTNILDRARDRAKCKKLMTVYIHRIKNKSYPSELKISDNEFKYWDEYIFNENNLKEYAALEKFQMHEKKTLREGFINKIIADRLGYSITVKKFDETKQELVELSDSEVNAYVKEKFIKLLSYQKMRKDNHKTKNTLMNEQVSTKLSKKPKSHDQIMSSKKKKYYHNNFY